MNEVDLRSYLLPKHRSVFSALRNLGVSIGFDGWCLVGGLTVLVVGAAHGSAGRRSEGTKDGDVVVDIAAEHRMLEAVQLGTLRRYFDPLGLKMKITVESTSPGGTTSGG